MCREGLSHGWLRVSWIIVRTCHTVQGIMVNIVSWYSEGFPTGEIKFLSLPGKSRQQPSAQWNEIGSDLWYLESFCPCKPPMSGVGELSSLTILRSSKELAGTVPETGCYRSEKIRVLAHWNWDCLVALSFHVQKWGSLCLSKVLYFSNFEISKPWRLWQEIPPLPTGGAVLGT